MAVNSSVAMAATSPITFASLAPARTSPWLSSEPCRSAQSNKSRMSEREALFLSFDKKSRARSRQARQAALSAWASSLRWSPQACVLTL